MNRGPWVQTFTGVSFYPLDPRPEEVQILDVAHSLASICRFNGHSLQFYSVAQHSVLASIQSQSLDPQAAFWGLMHDAAEAYIGDITRPLKRTIDGIDETERRIAEAIIARFDVPVSDSIREVVHLVDNRLLVTEARDLMAPPPAPWDLPFEPYEWNIRVPWSPQEAEGQFMHRFTELERAARVKRMVEEPPPKEPPKTRDKAKGAYVYLYRLPHGYGRWGFVDSEGNSLLTSHKLNQQQAIAEWVRQHGSPDRLAKRGRVSRKRFSEIVEYISEHGHPPPPAW